MSFTLRELSAARLGRNARLVLARRPWIRWLTVGAIRGKFGPQYFTPVDLGGLYWHVVDLIWIYLFLLLYLI